MHAITAALSGMFAWVASWVPRAPPPLIAKEPEKQPDSWKVNKASAPCDVCGLYTASHPSNSWRAPGAKFKWGRDRLCYVCESGLEGWPSWKEGHIVNIMPNQRAVWVAVVHTNKLRRACNLRKKLKGRTSHSAYRPVISQKRISELLVINAKPT